jgi:hypothetical protein
MLAPDDNGVPYPSGVDNAGLASLSDCATTVRLSIHSDL